MYIWALAQKTCILFHFSGKRHGKLFVGLFVGTKYVYLLVKGEAGSLNTRGTYIGAQDTLVLCEGERV